MRKILTTRFPNNPTAVQHFGGLLGEYQNSGFAPPNMNSELATQDDKGRKFWSHVWEARWVEWTKDKGVFLLCSDGIDLHAAWNPCAEEKSTPFPIFEIMKGDKGFYITGIPLHF
jgi:hypothetical protein